MDLRSLINKLDTLDQKQLLKESDEVFEALTGIQYSDVDALARQFPPPKDTERAAALAKMAKDNNLPGLFDPFTNKYVNASTGKFAVIGAYDAEVTVLKNKGLIPLGATTSNFGMGQDQATAQSGNLSAQEIIKKAYRADQIMDLALPKMANQLQIAPAAAPAARESLSLNIANSLMEEFGYASKEVLAEAIDRAQHQELKKLVTDLKPYEGSNHQVAQVMVLFASYNRERDKLIREILSLINRIKRRLAKKSTQIATAPKAAAEAPAASQAGAPKAVQESIRIDLAEGVEDQWLYHSGSLAEGTLKFVNSRTNKVYARGTIVEDVDGTQYVLVEAPAIGANAGNVPKPAPAAPAAGGNVPPQPTLNGKPSTGPKGQEWLKKYGATHNADGTPKTADTSTKKAEPERGTLQRVDDTIRAVANVWTGGWADNVEAKLNSWVNGTTYGSELKKSLAHTDAASKSSLIKFNALGKEWNPSAYDVGSVVGAVSMLPSLGWKATAALIAADAGQEKFGRDPHNKSSINNTSFKDEFGKSVDSAKAAVGSAVDGVKDAVGLGGKKDEKGQGGKKLNIPFDKDVAALQQQLKDEGFGDLLGTTGAKKDGVDGQFAGKTEAALKAAIEKGWTVDQTTKKLVKVPAQVPAASNTASSAVAQSANDGNAGEADAARNNAGPAQSANDGKAGEAEAARRNSDNPNGLSADQRYLQSIQVNRGTVAIDIQRALGKTPTGELGPEDVTAFTAYVQKNGGDPFDSLGKLLGLTPDSTTATESKNSQPLSLTESMTNLRLKLSQIDEASKLGTAWDIISKIAGKGAEKEVAAGAKATVPDAAAAAARPKLSDLPVTKHQATPGNLNFDAAKGERMTALDGKTYERMNGGSWYEVTASGKLGKGATREVQAELNAAAQAKGLDMQVMINKMASGEKLAANEIAAIEKGLAEKFGFKAGQAWAKVAAGGGNALRWMKNNKWLTAFILLSAAGLAWWALTPADPDKPVGPNSPVDTNVPPAVTSVVPGREEQGGMDADTQEELDELRQRLQELVDGWPDDAETASALTAAAEVGAKPANDKTATGQGGKSVANSANSSKVLDVSRTRGAAGSSYDAMVKQDTQRQ